MSAQTMPKLNMVIVAHPDDEVLGFGGTGQFLVNRGELVQPVILCTSADKRSAHPGFEELSADMCSANDHLGFLRPITFQFPNLELGTLALHTIVSEIEKLLIDLAPFRIFTHSTCDLNEDHRIVSQATQVALRIFQRKVGSTHSGMQLLFMEILSSTEWFVDPSLRKFSPNFYIPITAEEVERKIEALGKYRGVLMDPPHPRSPESLRSLASYRGVQSGSVYSEAFELVWSVLARSELP